MLTTTGLAAKSALNADDISQLRELTEVCNRFDGIQIKLNWNMMADRDAARINDLCFTVDGKLAGYMPLDDFGGQVEITAVVTPDHRRKGIFRAMLDAARGELANRAATELLLVNYRASKAGCAVIKRMAFPYTVSEYCMEADAAAIPSLPGGRIELEEVTPANVDDLSRTLKLTFGEARWNGRDILLRELERPEKRYFLAQFEGQSIGQIGIITKDEYAYIRAVGIVPEWRHKGLGRQLLAATIARMLDEGRRHFELDVATENSQALSLYQSCGFHETNIYDYYSVPLS